MVAYDYSNAMTQAPSAFQSAEAIRAAISIARRLGMVFSDCGGAGHWERARELLRKREYVVCVLAELDNVGSCGRQYRDYGAVFSVGQALGNAVYGLSSRIYYPAAKATAVGLLGISISRPRPVVFRPSGAPVRCTVRCT